MSNGVAFAFAACVLSPMAWGQTPAGYPSKPIRFIIPFPPGASANDILGRAMAHRLGQRSAGHPPAAGLTSTG